MARTRVLGTAAACNAEAGGDRQTSTDGPLLHRTTVGSDKAENPGAITTTIKDDLARAGKPGLP
jgi:hypothetical protein